MINLTVNKNVLEKAIERAKENNIIIPTFAQMRDPGLIPEKIKQRLKNIGLWDVNSYNLFRITWKNEPVPKGGLYGDVNYFELPSELTGVKARIVALVGKWFPTGSHKVGATFGCLVPRLVTGQFDPTTQKAVWPSTGNYCRGGAYDAQLLGCESIAILPEGMSRERFEWLSKVAGEVIGTPGSESNVKEIFDKCNELKSTHDNVVIFNQFDEMGNRLWHYVVTGPAMEEVLQKILGEKDRLAGEYLKSKYPNSKLAVSEALQCPTLLYNGFGAHRIEGIGDKHVPWIHNVKNTDMVMAIDDNDAMNLIRLFNEPEGKDFLRKQGVSSSVVNNLSLLGISSIANVLSAIKFAKYYELTDKDVVMTVFTDSMELYDSRLKELQEQKGKYSEQQAAVDFQKHLMGVKTDFIQELSYYDKKRIHNLKYYTWIEQQGKELDELNEQWYNDEEYWGNAFEIADKIDQLIIEFNKKTGLLG
jgi:cysteine synthase